MNDKNLAEDIRHQKLVFLYAELPKGIFASLILGILLVLALEGDVPAQNLYIWYGLMIVASTMRLFTVFLFKREKEQKANLSWYTNVLIVGIVISALLWASSSFYIYPSQSEHQLLLLFCIAGLSAGATGSTAYLYRVYALFVWIMVIPFIIVLAMEGGKDSFLMAFALILYLLIVSVTAWNTSRNFEQTLLLRYKNLSLIEDLELKAKEAEEASAAKSMFLSTMSHEIRTPLNAIMGYISLLKKEEKDEQKREKLAVINQSSNLLLGVINDILDFSKITSGNLQLEHSPCDLGKELEKLASLFKPLCSQKNITLSIFIDPTLPACIETDLLRLTQILNNLFSNAIKFTPEGKEIEFRAEYKRPNIYLEVSDRGIGISQDKQKVIFESFQQADSSTTREYGGTGLGLAISSRLAMLFGGELKVISVKGEGSTFFFTIRAKICAELQEAKEEVLEEVRFSAEDILVADDNKTNQTLMKLMLEEMNLRVRLANDGQEAFGLYDKRYALVLMDINMPRMNGIEAMQKIKSRYPEATIIALTANALNDEKEEYLSYGFDDYLSKPVQADTLTTLLKKYISV